MPDLEQLVEFLDRNGSLMLSDDAHSPPPDDSDAYEIDWDRVFPKESGEDRDTLEQREDWPGYGILADEFGPLIGRRPELEEAKRIPVIESPQHFCAWYQAIHFHAYDFGIFIRQPCVLKWAGWVSRFLPLGTRLTPAICRRLLRAAIYILFLHEHYHHKVESLGFRLHVSTGHSHYLPYRSQVYAKCVGTDDQLEEALANADSYLRLQEDRYRKSIAPEVVKALREYLRWSFPHCQPGYRTAPMYLGNRPFDDAENVLQERVRTGVLVQAGTDWVCAPQMTRSILTVREPIWWLVPRGSRPVVPVTSAPMRTCSSDQLVKLCESRGYQKVDGGKGSHVKLKRPNSPMVIVPGNRDNVSPGSARSTLKALGIPSLGELPELVKRLSKSDCKES